MLSRLREHLLKRLRPASISTGISVADITALTALTGLTNGQVVHVRDPDRGGTFVFTTGGADSADEGITFDADYGRGVFTRQGVHSGYNPKWWGAKENEGPDYTDAFTRCIAAVERERANDEQPYLGKSRSSVFKHNEAYVDVTPGIYRITSTLTLRNASIIGRSKSSCVIFHDVSEPGDLFSSPYTDYRIIGASSGTRADAFFEIAGDHSSLFKKNSFFEVVGSSGDDGKYTVKEDSLAVTKPSVHHEIVTIISVVETVRAASADGSVRAYSGSHYAIDIHNLTLVGTGDLVEDLEDPRKEKFPRKIAEVTSNRAVNFYRAIWACSISNVIISQFQTGICALNCWVFRIEDSMIFNCPRCLEWYGPVSLDCTNTRFEACYARAAGVSDDGVYIGRGSACPEAVSFTGCAFQGAGKSGVYVDNATNIVFSSCFFERNNLEDRDNAYCSITRSLPGHTSAATFIGCSWTPAKAKASNSVCLDLVKVRHTNLIGCEMRDGAKESARDHDKEFASSIRADSQCGVVNLIGTEDATARGMDLDSSVSVRQPCVTNPAGRARCETPSPDSRDIRAPGPDAPR